MKLNIIIKHNYKNYRLIAELIDTKPSKEYWKITAGKQTFVLTNNRPVLVKNRLKHWEPEYKQFEGHIPYVSIVSDIGKAIEEARNKETKKGG